MDIKAAFSFVFVISWIYVVAGKCKEYLTRDVTRWPQYVDSHEYFGSRQYERNKNRCMLVYTNHTDHIIRMRQNAFALSTMPDQCWWDYLTIYDSAGFQNEIGRYCEHEGPGFINSTGQTMFLYFETDQYYEDTGFRLEAISAVVDKPPPENPGDDTLSAGAIAGIVIAIVILTSALTVVALMLIIHNTKLKQLFQGSPESKTNPDEHVYAVPERVPSVESQGNTSFSQTSFDSGFTHDVGDSSSNNTPGMSFPARSYNYDNNGGGERSVGMDQPVENNADDSTLKDYRGYDLPSYIATVSSNNGPPLPAIHQRHIVLDHGSTSQSTANPRKVTGTRGPPGIAVPYQERVSMWNNSAYPSRSGRQVSQQGGPSAQYVVPRSTPVTRNTDRNRHDSTET